MKARVPDPAVRFRRFMFAVVTVALFLVLLVVAFVLEGQRWEVSYVPQSAYDVLWDPETSSLFTSNQYFVGQYRHSGERLDATGWVRVRNESFGAPLFEGPMALSGNWLFFARDVTYLVLMNVTAWPTDGRFHHVSDIDHRGPVSLWWAFGFPGWYTVYIGDMDFYGDTLLVAGNGGTGRVLALDMTDPSSVTGDPASLRTLYNVSFGGLVFDLLVDDQSLYVLEQTGPGSTLHVLDLAPQPPQERFAFPLEWSWRLDVHGSLIAVSTNTTVSLYRLAAGSLERLASVPLPERTTGGVTLEGERVYARWGDPESGRVGLSIFDASSPSALRELWRFEFDGKRTGLATGLAIGDSGAYLPGGRGALVAMFYATRPALLTSVPLGVALVVSGGAAIIAVIRFRTVQRPSGPPGPRDY